jgi:ribose/xylose/arabinose/galactoside ABC-type transport system permease subunit
MDNTTNGKTPYFFKTEWKEIRQDSAGIAMSIPFTVGIIMALDDSHIRLMYWLIALPCAAMFGAIIGFFTGIAIIYFKKILTSVALGGGDPKEYDTSGW